MVLTIILLLFVFYFLIADRYLSACQISSDFNFTEKIIIGNTICVCLVFLITLFTAIGLKLLYFCYIPLFIYLIFLWKKSSSLRGIFSGKLDRIFILLALFYLFHLALRLAYKDVPGEWDELSYWAIIRKQYFFTSDIPRQSTSIWGTNYDYPLFHVLSTMAVSMLRGIYEENVARLFNLSYFILFLFWVYEKVYEGVKSFFLSSLCMVAVFGVIFGFNGINTWYFMYLYKTGYGDGLLGILLAVSYVKLSQVLSEGVNTPKNYFLFSTGILHLAYVFLKPIGLFFFPLSLLVVFVTSFLYSPGRRLVSSVKNTAIFGAAPVCMMLVWKIYLYYYDIPLVQSKMEGVISLGKFDTEKALYIIRGIWGFSISQYKWLTICYLLSLIIYFLRIIYLNRRSSSRDIAFLAFLLPVCNAVILFSAYMFKLSKYESQLLHSLERYYYHTLPIMVFAVILLFRDTYLWILKHNENTKFFQICRSKSIISKPIGIILVLAIFGILYQNIRAAVKSYDNNGYGSLVWAREKTASLAHKFERGEKVYYFAEGDDGYLYYAFRYAMFPAVFQVQCWAFPKSAEDTNNNCEQFRSRENFIRFLSENNFKKIFVFYPGGSFPGYLGLELNKNKGYLVAFDGKSAFGILESFDR
ncbi:MAG: hypothetical protein HQK54_06225 [Oligoflexales bacterium]|nr:hypothetical protein [Oligoflexales bacterium]